MTNWKIETLSRKHDRKDFHCGNESLDQFIHSLVSQYEKRRLGRTYVARETSSSRVYGYYTLSSGAVAFENLPPKAARKLPRHPVPVALLARLAVDTKAQGKGLGKLLLVDALRRSLRLSSELGIHAVEVHAIDESARTFYERYGFVGLQSNPRHLYLPISTIESAFR